MTKTHTVKIHNRFDLEIGKLRQSWHRLPQFIRIDDTLYERYGLLGDYRYVECEEAFQVTEENAEVLWIA